MAVLTKTTSLPSILTLIPPLVEFESNNKLSKGHKILSGARSESRVRSCDATIGRAFLRTRLARETEYYI